MVVATESSADLASSAFIPIARTAELNVTIFAAEARVLWLR
jgi:hypothetical protein